jgi:hypothetical protein
MGKLSSGVSNTYKLYWLGKLWFWKFWCIEPTNDAFFEKGNYRIEQEVQKSYPGRHCTYKLQYWPKVNHGPAHFLRARSARHLQYMNGRHTRNKRVMKRASNAVMTRECHVDVRMLCECCAHPAQMSRGCCTDEAHFICATTLQQSPLMTL